MNYDLTIYKPEDGPQSVFYASNPGKGSARGREDDVLFALVSPSSVKLLDAPELVSVLEAQARLFHKTSGSVTKAMRVFMDGINKHFQQKNSHFDSAETWQTASLCLGVIHYDTLFLAQIGQSSAHVIRAGEDEIFFDPDVDKRGLGAATVVNPRYFQTSLQGNETLLILPDPENGDKQAQSNMVQIRKGSGKLEFRNIAEHAPDEGHPVQEEYLKEADEPIIEGSIPDTSEAETIPYVPSLAEDLFSQAVLLPDEAEMLEEDDVAENEEEALEETAGLELSETKSEIILPSVQGSMHEDELEEAVEHAEREVVDMAQLKEKALHGVATGASWLRRAEEKAESVSRIGRTQADPKTGMSSELSPMLKVLIAIIVPLIIVGLTSIIYFSRGEDHQYNYLLAQAQASVANAPLMQTTESQREGWEQALSWINQAGAFKESAEVKALRAQAQTALDSLDGARRLQFVPAYAASLHPNLRISEIVSLNNDLYLLDQASGSVKYMRLRNTGYEMDETFKCGPGTYDGIEVGRLVDLISVPLNNPAKAPILAIDQGGNLLYCSPTSSATAISLQAPETGWADLKKIVFDSNRLYVLDPINNALWKYRGLASNFTDPATSYFKDQKPELTSVVDFEVEGEELFLLYQDGHSAHCLESMIMGTVTCEEPYPYLNSEGVDNDLDTANLFFDQLAYSPPPDPSIYYLEPERGSLYQFSLRLNLNKVLRFGTSDGSKPSDQASAFFVSPDRRVFLAFGNQLYHAVLP